MVTKEKYLEALETIQLYTEQLENRCRAKMFDVIITDARIDLRYKNIIRSCLKKEDVRVSELVEFLGCPESVSNELFKLRNMGIKGVAQLMPYINQYMKINEP